MTHTQPAHELTIRPVYLHGWTSYGPVPIVSGYVGTCSCGVESPELGSQKIVEMWFEHHIGERPLHRIKPESQNA